MGNIWQAALGRLPLVNSLIITNSKVNTNIRGIKEGLIYLQTGVNC